MFSGLGGWSVLITLIAFLQAGLREALDNCQKKGGESLPPRSPPTHSSFLHYCRSGWGHTARFSPSLIRMAVVPCCCITLCWLFAPGPSWLNVLSLHTRPLSLARVLFLAGSLTNMHTRNILHTEPLFSLTCHGHLSKTIFIYLIHCLPQLYFVNVCYASFWLFLSMFLNLLVLGMSFLNSI